MNKKNNTPAAVRSDGKRRDDKGRFLRNGEYQRKDGRYVYKYTNLNGEVRCLYASRLEPKDKVPAGKRSFPASVNWRSSFFRTSGTASRISVGI